MSQNTDKLDPVTTAVVRGFLESTCRDMGRALTRNAQSPIFIEGQDFSCAVLDPRRRLAAAANYDPSHLCSMPYSVDVSTIEFGLPNLNPGDIIISNDPYRGGTHLPDVTMSTPVFVDGAVVAYAVTRAHHLDIGGMSAGSVPGGARDVYAEGLRIPPTKWAVCGRENAPVIDAILSNVRLPDVELNDLRAQAASLLTGTERVVDLCDRFGAQTIIAAMAELQAQSEALVRAFITEIPDGSYDFVDYMDGDGNTEFRYAIRVRVDVLGSRLVIDFDGTSAQAEGAINLPYAMTASSVFNAILQLAGNDIPFNHGCFEPVRFNAPRGSLVNAQPPAPTFGCTTDTPLRVIDAVVGALAPAVPDRVIAGSYGTCNIIAGSGIDDDAEQFLYWFFFEGGMGAGAARDGWNVTPNQSANFRDYPVEVIETMYPLIVDEVSLAPDSGGAGTFRGGVGSVHQFTFTARTLLSGFGDRQEIRPYGLAGGQPGAASRFLYRRAGSQDWVGMADVTINDSKFSGLVAESRDSLRVMSGGGGGFGDPAQRDPTALERDLREGLVTADGVQAYRSDAPATDCLTAFSDESAIGVIKDSLPADDIGERVRAALASADPAVCMETCPLQANPAACAFYHPQALDFWAKPAITLWAQRNCLLADQVTSALK